MRLIRYFMVGGVAASVDLAIFICFAKWLGYNYLAVAAVGFIIATCVNYMLSIRFAFTSGARFDKRQEVALVYAISALGLLVNQAVLYTGIGLLGFEMVACKVAATFIVFVWNYLARAQFVFRPVGATGIAHADTGHRWGGISR